ncbi:MAG: GNAT family N-acetyltransferase [Xanthobacteraceae bacterium]|nr:GNAT family N-acetyltransferase [Xanthobacteraceae bacterium]
MLQETLTQNLRESRAIVLETKRLVLRQPTLADIKAIAGIVGDHRVASNLRRVPHPYSQDDATHFVSTMANVGGMTTFLIERQNAAVGLASLTWEKSDAPELGYCLDADHWGQGFATEAARALIDFAFEEFSIDVVYSGARVLNPASRHVLEKCGFQWTGVELHRFLALGSSTPVDRFRLERGVWSSLKGWSNAIRR